MFVDDSELDKFYLIMKERDLTDDEFKEMNRIDSLTKTYAKARTKGIIENAIKNNKITKKYIKQIKNFMKDMYPVDCYEIFFTCEYSPDVITKKFKNLFVKKILKNYDWFYCFCQSRFLTYEKFGFKHAKKFCNLFDEHRKKELLDIIDKTECYYLNGDFDI